MTGVPVKDSKPAVGTSATRSPKADVTHGQKPAGGGSLPGGGAKGKEGQMQVTDTKISNPVANTQGAPENKGAMKTGPQDSTAQLAGKKAKKARSAAAILYPGMPLKE